MKRIALLALAAPAILEAQAPADTTMVHARVWFRDGGQLVRRTELLAPIGDSVIVRGALVRNGPLITIRVPTSEVARLEHSVLRTSDEGMKQGAKMGAILGFLTGVALTADAIGWRDPDANNARIGDLIFIGGTLTMTFAGTASGALLGALARGGKWVCVPNAPCEPRP